MAFKKNEIEFESDKVKIYVQQIQAENGILKQECKQLKGKLLVTLGKAGLRQSDKEFYEQQLDQLKFDYTELKKRHNDSFEQFKQLREQLEAYKMEAEEGKEINAELKAENKVLTEQLAEMMSQAALLPRFFGLSAEEITQLVTKCSQLEEENDELKNKINSLICSENCYKYKQSEQLKADNKHLNDLLNQALKELEQSREAIEKVREIANNAYCLTNYTNKDMAQFAKQIIQICDEVNQCENQ